MEISGNHHRVAAYRERRHRRARAADACSARPSFWVTTRSDHFAGPVCQSISPAGQNPFLARLRRAQTVSWMVETLCCSRKGGLSWEHLPISAWPAMARFCFFWACLQGSSSSISITGRRQRRPLDWVDRWIWLDCSRSPLAEAESWTLVRCGNVDNRGISLSELAWPGFAGRLWERSQSSEFTAPGPDGTVGPRGRNHSYDGCTSVAIVGAHCSDRTT